MDYEDKMFTHNLKNVIYFTDSLVNILSDTMLNESI